jgi:hypothetical protein
MMTVSQCIQASVSFVALMVMLGLLTSCADLERQPPNAPVRLLAPLEFAGFTVHTNLTKEAASKLMREKVKVGSDDVEAYNFLALPASPPANSNPAQPPGLPAIGQRIRVETVEQYLAALKQGAAPFSTFDLSMNTHFYATAASLLFVAGATESRRSLLPTKLLTQLPASVLTFNESDQHGELEPAARNRPTLDDYRLKGKLSRFQSTATSLTFESSDRRYLITELARGDYNRDGFEDSLILVYWHHEDGSGFWVEIQLVQRPATGPLLVTLFPLQ